MVNQGIKLLERKYHSSIIQNLFLHALEIILNIFAYSSWTE